MLAKEFGIPPMEETQALYSQIYTEGHDRHHSPIQYATTSFDQAMEQIRQATNSIDLARDQIQQALQFVTKFTEHKD